VSQWGEENGWCMVTCAFSCADICRILSSAFSRRVSATAVHEPPCAGPPRSCLHSPLQVAHERDVVAGELGGGHRHVVGELRHKRERCDGGDAQLRRVVADPIEAILVLRHHVRNYSASPAWGLVAGDWSGEGSSEHARTEIPIRAMGGVGCRARAQTHTQHGVHDPQHDDECRGGAVSVQYRRGTLAAPYSPTARSLPTGVPSSFSAASHHSQNSVSVISPPPLVSIASKLAAVARRSAT